MASQTVVKACAVGVMLRQIRPTMEVKVWESALSETLGRTRQWANQLIVLSFRHSTVLDALANGKANDSIRSAYKFVKSLPEQAEETKTFSSVGQRLRVPMGLEGTPGGNRGSSNAVKGRSNEPATTL